MPATVVHRHHENLRAKKSPPIFTAGEFLIARMGRGDMLIIKLESATVQSCYVPLHCFYANDMRVRVAFILLKTGIRFYVRPPARERIAQPL